MYSMQVCSELKWRFAIFRLSYEVESESVIKPCIQNDNPQVD